MGERVDQRVAQLAAGGSLARRSRRIGARIRSELSRRRRVSTPTSSSTNGRTSRSTRGTAGCRRFARSAISSDRCSDSLGAVPKKAREYANQFLDEWENESINAWHSWLPAVRSLGDLVGSVLGVAP